jgi:hypothetical protein
MTPAASAVGRAASAISGWQAGSAIAAMDGGSCPAECVPVMDGAADSGVAFVMRATYRASRVRTRGSR